MRIGSQTEREADCPICPCNIETACIPAYSSSSVLARPGHVRTIRSEENDGTPACLYDDERKRPIPRRTTLQHSTAHLSHPATLTARAQKGKSWETPKPTRLNVSHHQRRRHARNPTLLFAKLSGLLGLLVHVVGVVVDLHADYTVASRTYRRASSLPPPMP